MKRKLMVLISVLLVITWMSAWVQSKPTTLISGTPYLFNRYEIKVDPNEASNLSPAFQAANGAYGANLVAYFGTGNLN